MGCQTIARYLETLPENVKIGGAVFVAGFFKELTNLEDEEEVHDVAKEWMTTPLNLDEVKKHLDKSIAIFSDNDKFVPLSNTDDYKEKLGSEIVIQHDMGHFTEDEGIKELPAALDAILQLANK
jgi:predicted alpha/beta hydrolase family esterase